MNSYSVDTLMKADHSTVALFIQTEQWILRFFIYYPSEEIRQEALQHIWLGVIK